MAQVYAFTDSNGETRLFAEIHPDPAGTPFNGGTITEGLTIADPDPVETQLLVNLPAGTSSHGTTILLFNGEGVANPLALDAYGTLSLQADTVDPTNGGGALQLLNAASAPVHRLFADDGNGNGTVGFYATPPVTQGTLTSGTATPEQITLALQRLGLVGGT